MPTETGQSPTPLKRTLGTASLVLYGLGTIVGAGIYVLIGEVIVRAGMTSPASFILAGVLVALTGLSYAELSARHPEAMGAAAYVRHAFGSDLASMIVGLMTITVAIITAASITRGGVGYLEPIIDIPAYIAGGGVVIFFTVIAAYGVRESVVVAVLMTMIEIGGLIYVIVTGGGALEQFPAHAQDMIPGTSDEWVAVAGGAFLAFFAFTGFEVLANMAEETLDEKRVIPRAIILSIVISTALYMMLLLVAVLGVPVAEFVGVEAPLCLIVDCTGPGISGYFPIIAIIATLNGVLIEIILVSRVVYAMARRNWLPKILSQVHPARQTPVVATVLSGGLILLLAVGLPFETLVRMTSGLLLCIFIAVNLSLMRLHRIRSSATPNFHIPKWVPPTAAFGCAVLLMIEIFG